MSVMASSAAKAVNEIASEVAMVVTSALVFMDCDGVWRFEVRESGFTKWRRCVR